MKSLHENQDCTIREIALERLGGDEKLYAALAGFFLADTPALMKQLCDAHQAGDLDTVFRRAHSLKGLSATFEAVPFMELAAEIEAFAGAGDAYHTHEKIPKLTFEYERLQEYLRNFAS